jgi:hypothetical protein
VLAAGCLDSEVPQAPNTDEPLTWVAVANDATTALPPKPALAQLATAPALTRQRFLDAALGTDASDVFTTVVALGLAPPECPTTDRRGRTFYSTPDCTDDAGVHWSGRLVAHSWDDDRPMQISLERWSADAPGTKDDRAYDGTLTVHRTGQIDANLVVWRGGLVTRTFASYSLAWDDMVTVDQGSWVLMQDHGLAQIGGAWSLTRNGRPAGALFLDGADEMMVDFDEAGNTDCAPIYVDGALVSKRCDLAALAEHMVAFELF